MKPLYCPRPIPLSTVDLRRASQVHWSNLVHEAERVLMDVLAVPPGVSVCLVDKCTHALSLSMSYLKERLGAGTALIPRSTYRATVDAAKMAGLKVELTDTCIYSPDSIHVPVTLGGDSVSWEDLCDERTVIDAAHTGYQGMLAGTSNWRALVCLSFFPTKPLGAFGGGAIIGPEQIVEHIRETAYPFTKNQMSSFMYPQGIQSLALMRRLRSPQTWKDHQQWTATAIAMISALEASGFRLRWEFVVPHILSVVHENPQMVAELRDFVRSKGYETGRHYEPLDLPRADDVWVALPFIYPELVDILEKQYGQGR